MKQILTRLPLLITGEHKKHTKWTDSVIIIFSTQKGLSTWWSLHSFYFSFLSGICTYNEPAKVIEKTVAAAAALAYPQDRLRVFVCDDGRRLEIKRVAEKYGAHWITRPNNKYAKAGNLNNCLQTASDAEYFLILDADVVVRSCFLEHTMGYFYDPKVAFVQALIPAQAQLQEFLENAKRADTHKIAIALVRVLGDKSWKSRLVCTKHHSSN